MRRLSASISSVLQMGVVAADAAPNDMETSRSLEKLSLGGLKKITPAGIERLRKSCPKLTIDSK